MANNNTMVVWMKKRLVAGVVCAGKVRRSVRRILRSVLTVAQSATRLFATASESVFRITENTTKKIILWNRVFWYYRGSGSVGIRIA
jgi:hypothetical protein